MDDNLPYKNGVAAAEEADLVEALVMAVFQKDSLVLMMNAIQWRGLLVSKRGCPPSNNCTILTFVQGKMLRNTTPWPNPISQQLLLAHLSMKRKHHQP